MAVTGQFDSSLLQADCAASIFMDTTQLATCLHQLLDAWESEVVEFKRADNDYDTDKIGEYFSALSNEANLRGQERAWLVFGVDDKSRAVVGSGYRMELDRLQSLKHQVAQSTEPSVTFRHIHVLAHSAGRVLMFEIPAAPRGMPIAWKGHYYARAGESRASLGLDKLDEIRSQTLSLTGRPSVFRRPRWSTLMPRH